MLAIEFQTRIENGTIQVPKEHQPQLADQGGDKPVRVIILMPGQKPVPDLIDQSLDSPIVISNFTPLTRDQAHERS